MDSLGIAMTGALVESMRRSHGERSVTQRRNQFPESLVVFWSRRRSAVAGRCLEHNDALRSARFEQTHDLRRSTWHSYQQTSFWSSVQIPAQAAADSGIVPPPTGMLLSQPKQLTPKRFSDRNQEQAGARISWPRVEREPVSAAAEFDTAAFGGKTGPVTAIEDKSFPICRLS
jgi:hypothetical protein